MRKSAVPVVSERNTKNEILEAYTQLLSQVEDKKETTGTPTDEQQAVSTAAHETVEKIVGDLSQLRLSANQTINNLTEKLTEEAERFATIQKAIASVQKELADTQKVKLHASQLYQLIELHKRTEQQLAQEITAQRAAWEDEQKLYAQRLQRERAREQEEYDYNKKLQRKRDTDLWEEEKQKHERQQEEETKTRVALMQELEELRKKVALFPSEIEKEAKLRVSEALAKAQHETQMKQALQTQEADAKLKLTEQRVASLQAALTAMSNENKDLKQQLEKATNHIKDIAVSVVEGTRKETTPQTKPLPDSGK